MPLTTYDDVRPWARAIKEQVLTRRMPKWSAAHGYGAFANDPSLSSGEMETIASWVDGGQPKGVGAARSAPPRPPGAAAFNRLATPLTVPAAATEATLRTPVQWVGGWDFTPGDPLITSATFTSIDGTPIGTWVAGDLPVRLPAGAGIRIAPPIHVELQRRPAADYETAAPAKRSTLQLLSLPAAPARRVWVEQTTCGTPRVGRAVELLAVRPLLADHDSQQLWLERPGAPQRIVGWFRDADVHYRRTFWLARPAELNTESRLASDRGCIVEVTLATARR
jgi:hypothetical protein